MLLESSELLKRTRFSGVLTSFQIIAMHLEYIIFRCIIKIIYLEKLKQLIITVFGRLEL